MYMIYFIYGYVASNMVKDHSGKDRLNPQPSFQCCLFFLLAARESYCLYTSVVDHWLEQDIARFHIKRQC